MIWYLSHTYTHTAAWNCTCLERRGDIGLSLQLLQSALMDNVSASIRVMYDLYCQTLARCTQTSQTQQCSNQLTITTLQSPSSLYSAQRQSIFSQKLNFSRNSPSILPPGTEWITTMRWSWEYSVPGKRPLPGKGPCTAFQGATMAASIQTYGILIPGKRPCGPKSQVTYV